MYHCGLKVQIFFLLLILMFSSVCSLSFAAQPPPDPSHIEVYITPFYDSTGTKISIGHFSRGIASEEEDEFLATIREMEKSWDQLSFVELYVAAIRLYERGYRNDSVYWFYTAQYRGRLFATLVDPKMKGGIGSEGFELQQAQNAFYQLVGPYINGFALGNSDGLIKVVEKVQKENKNVIDLQKIHSNVAFIDKQKWQAENDKLAKGMSELISQVKEKKDDLKRMRIESGVEEAFAKLTSKDLPSADSKTPR